MLCRLENGTVQILTRNGHDWTDRMPRLRDVLAKLPVDNAWIDGEAVVLDSAGVPNFNALQNAFDRRSTSEIILFLFDLLYINGTDIREEPLRTRRDLLRALMNEANTDLLRFSDDFDVGALWVNEATRFRLDNYPFGGMKRSGVGREGVRYAIEEFSQIKFTGITI